MIRRLLTIALVGVTLALGAVVAPEPVQAAPASTESVEAPGHWTNPEWAYICASRRPPERPDVFVEHAHPYYMDANHVRFYCNGDTPSGLEECTWHVIAWTGGTTTGPYGAEPYCELNTDGLQSVQFFRMPASRPMHTPNAYANWACGGSRVSPNHIVYHAVPVVLDPAYLTAYCFSNYLSGVEPVQWHAILWWNGEISVVGGSNGWHFCNYEFCSAEP